MHSSLVGRLGNCWIVEAPDGDQHVLPGVNVVTGGVPAFVGMEGVMVSVAGRGGMCRRFYARWTSGTPLASMVLSPSALPETAIHRAIMM